MPDDNLVYDLEGADPLVKKPKVLLAGDYYDSQPFVVCSEDEVALVGSRTSVVSVGDKFGSRTRVLRLQRIRTPHARAIEDSKSWPAQIIALEQQGAPDRGRGVLARARENRCAKAIDGTYAPLRGENDAGRLDVV